MRSASMSICKGMRGRISVTGRSDMKRNGYDKRTVQSGGWAGR